MGRRVERVDAASDEEREALLDRRSRHLELRLSTWGWTADPPNAGDRPPDALSRALDRARELPHGPARRDAIEAAGREHVGDDAVDRVLRSGPGGDPDGAWNLTQANLARAHERPAR